MRLTQALAGWETYERLGSPEGELAIAQVVVYLGTAPKSNAVYTAFGQAKAAAKATGSLMPPAHILNAPTRLMKQLGYGAGYEYDHRRRGRLLRPELLPRRHGPHRSSTSRRTEASNARSPVGSNTGPNSRQAVIPRRFSGCLPDPPVASHA